MVHQEIKETHNLQNKWRDEGAQKEAESQSSPTHGIVVYTSNFQGHCQI